MQHYIFSIYIENYKFFIVHFLLIIDDTIYGCQTSFIGDYRILANYHM